MGNCESSFDEAKCNKLWAGQIPLEADPDIVGPGVLAAFGVTALITFGAIVIGYLTDSVPREYLNSVDVAVLDHLQKSRVAKWLGKAVHAWYGVTAILRRCLFMEPRSEKPLSRARREKILETVVLTLSDQQLVTGTAILVATYANYCSISMFEWNIMLSLAWFSAVTHLATLDVLQRYFRKNAVVRNWRIVGMMGVLGLLIAAEIITLLYEPGNAPIPLECFKGPNLKWYLESTDYPPFYIITSVLYAITSVLATALIVCYLIGGYTSRIASLITEPPIFHAGARITSTILVRILYRRQDPKERRDLVEGALEELEADLTERFRAPGVKTNLKIMHHYGRSFLVKMTGLVFILAYGICQVVNYRWFDDTPWLGAGTSRMDFGQIVPLILLLLPVFNGAELFYEEDEDHQKDSNTPEVSSDAFVEQHVGRIGVIFFGHIILVLFVAIVLSVLNISSVAVVVLVSIAAVLMGYYFVIQVSTLVAESVQMQRHIRRAISAYNGNMPSHGSQISQQNSTTSGLAGCP